MSQVLDFVPIWTLILGMAVFFYVLLDGFDLGVGMLYGLAPRDRPLIMNSVAPVWDGNETWLVFGGLGLLAAFPLAFAIIIPAVYFPILVMLLALIFRGVAFEFRWRAPGERVPAALSGDGPRRQLGPPPCQWPRLVRGRSHEGDRGSGGRSRRRGRQASRFGPSDIE